MPINPSYIQHFSKLEFLAKKIVDGFLTGLHKSPNHGFSVEFSEHRIYNQGESTKNIDWKLFGRTDKLYTKKYEEETNLRCHLITDCSGSMRFPESKNDNINHLNKLGFSIYACAALIELMKKQRDAVGLNFFDEKVYFSSPVKNTASHSHWLFENLETELLKKSVNQHSTDISTALRNIANTSKKRSLIILFSDFLSNNSENKEYLKNTITELQLLTHQKHEIIVFNVFDKNLEVDLNFENRPYKFVDNESGEEIKLNPEHVKKEYLQIKNKALQSLKFELLSQKIEYVECNINDGFEQILRSYLMKRKQLR